MMPIAGWTDNAVWPNGATGGNPWFTKIYPYIKNTGVFNCPSATYKWAGESSSSIKYGANATLIGGACALATIVRPVDTLAAADSEGTGSYTVFQAYYSGPSAPRYVWPIHFDGANFIFCDGHVKWVRVQKDASGNPVHPGVQQSVYWRADGTS